MRNLISIKDAPLPKKIRALGALKGINWFDVARKEGVDRTAIYKTIDGNIKSHRLRKAIADALGVAYEELWEKEAA
jgi:lambda repressor-like predicted transcriptional regulator